MVNKPADKTDKETVLPVSTEHLRLINDLNHGLNRGVPVENLVKTACDGLKQIHNLDAVLQMLLVPEAFQRESSLIMFYNNMDNALLHVAEQMAGIKANGLHVPYIRDSIYYELYSRGEPAAITDHPTIIRLFQDLVNPERRILRGLAGSVVKILQVQKVLFVPLIVDNKVIGHIACMHRRVLNEDEQRLIVLVCGQIAQIFSRKIFEDRLLDTEKRYSGLFNSMLDGFALHEIITDKKGRAVDYRFLEVNGAFEKLTGLVRSHILGKTAREVLPGLDQSWLERYGKVALEGAPVRFEQYSPELDKTFEVSSYSPAHGQFAAIISDITERVKSDQDRRIMETAMKQSPAIIMITDLEGSIIYVNPAFENITGYNSAEAVGKNAGFIKSGHHTAVFFKEFWDTIKSGQTWKGEIENRRKDGTLMWQESSVTGIAGPDGSLGYFIAIMVDITNRRQAEHQLRLNEERLKLALFASRQGLYDLDLITGQVYTSPEYNNMLGYTYEELKETLEGWLDKISPDDRPRVEECFREYLSGDVPSFMMEYRVVRKDGSKLWIESQASIVQWNSDGQPVRLVGTQGDITRRKEIESELEKARKELEEANRELERLVRIDPLTGISNRRHFTEALATEWRRAKRNKTPLSLIMIDIDYFKMYNDHYGHIMGDECLKKVAESLYRSLRRPPDLACRYGGEEFLALLPETGLSGAIRVAEIITQELKKLAITHSQSAVDPYVTLSMGIACHIPESDDQNPGVLVNEADQALYVSKKNGRNRYSLYQPASVQNKNNAPQ